MHWIIPGLGTLKPLTRSFEIVKKGQEEIIDLSFFYDEGRQELSALMILEVSSWPLDPPVLEAAMFGSSGEYLYGEKTNKDGIHTQQKVISTADLELLDPKVLACMKAAVLQVYPSPASTIGYNSFQERGPRISLHLKMDPDEVAVLDHNGLFRRIAEVFQNTVAHPSH